MSSLAVVTFKDRSHRGRKPRLDCFRWLFPWLGVLIVGCDFPGQRSAIERPQADAETQSFDVLYGRNCSGCHGADGRLGPAPPLNDPLFLAIVPDTVLENVIRDGRSGTLMPAFGQAKGGTLTTAQIQVLAHRIKLHWSKSEPKKNDLPRYLVAAAMKPQFRMAAIERGEKTFARACSGCHGTKGEGDSAGSIADPSFLALISDQALRRLMITGRPDLGMPDYSHSDGRDDDFRPLTSAEIDDLAVFVRHLGTKTAATARHDRSWPGLGAPIAGTRRETSN